MVPIRGGGFAGSARDIGCCADWGCNPPVMPLLVQVLCAFANGVSVLVSAGSIAWVGVHRLNAPPPLSRPDRVVLVAVGGLVVNVLGVVLFARARAHVHPTDWTRAHSAAPPQSVHTHRVGPGRTPATGVHAGVAYGTIKDPLAALRHGDAGGDLIIDGPLLTPVRSNWRKALGSTLDPATSQTASRHSSGDAPTPQVHRGTPTLGPGQRPEHSRPRGGVDPNSARGVYAHMVADTVGSVAVIVSAVCVEQYGLLAMDALCALLIAGLMGALAWPLLSAVRVRSSPCVALHRTTLEPPTAGVVFSCLCTVSWQSVVLAHCMPLPQEL